MTIAYLTQFFCTTAVSFDLGLVPLGAALIARGGHMYKDMHEVMFPGTFLCLAFFFKCFGTSWMVCKVVAVSIFLTIAALLLAASRQLMSGWSVFMPFLSFVILGAPICALNYYHWDALMWYLAFACILVSAKQTSSAGGNSGSLTLAALAGFFGGCSTACFQPAALPVFIGMVSVSVSSYYEHKKGKQAALLCAILMGSWLCLLGCLFIYIWSTDSLVPMYESTVKFVMMHYSTVNKVPYGYSSFVPMLVAQVPRLVGLLVGTPYFLLNALPLFVVVLIVVDWQMASTDRTRNTSGSSGMRTRLLLWTVLALAYWAMALHRPDIRRLFWSSQPLMVVFWAWAETVCRQSRLGKVALKLAGAVVVVGLMINGWLYWFDHGPFVVYQTPLGPVTTDSNLDIVQAISSRCKKGEKIFVYPWDTVIYFLTDTRFPSKFPYLQYRYHTEEQIVSVLNDLENFKVKYAAVNKRVNANSFAQYGFPGFAPVADCDLVVERYLNMHYTLLGDFGDYKLLARRD